MMPRSAQSHDLVEPPGGDDHAARVLSEVAWQVVNPAPHLGKKPNAVGRRVETRRFELGGEGFLVSTDEVVVP
jgi:hypothetical protein